MRGPQGKRKNCTLRFQPACVGWLNRDPIGERGGLNLYGMVGNDAVNQVDKLGLQPGLFLPPGAPGAGTFNPALQEHLEDNSNRDAGPPPKWFECIVSCGGEVLGIETAAAGTAAASGLIPVPYPRKGVGGGSSTGHTSVAGAVSSKILGQRKLPKCCGRIEIGTRKVPGAGTAKWARVAGRGVPIIGWVLLGIDGVQFGCCYYNCMKE